MKQVLIILGVLILLAAAGAGAWFASHRPDPRIPVSTCLVRRVESLVAQVNCSGALRPTPKAKLARQPGAPPMQAEMAINETDLTRVKIGQSARLHLSELAGLTTPTAHVEEIGASAMQENGEKAEGKTFRVVLALDTQPKKWYAGMGCEAGILIETRQNVLAIPIAALTQRPFDPATNAPVTGTSKTAKDVQGVFVRGADGKALFRPVKTGLMSEMDVELREGLKEGEEVITGPLASLRRMEEGSPLRMDKAE